MADVITSEYRLSAEPRLKRFVTTVLEKAGVAPADAAIVADVLVAADVRGIESHGVARLEEYYVRRIRAGNGRPARDDDRPRDADLAERGRRQRPGAPAAKRAMERVEKAGRPARPSARCATPTTSGSPATTR